MLNKSLKIASLISIVFSATQSLAVLDVSPMFCPSKDETHLEICGAAVWPSLPNQNWLKDDWESSYTKQLNFKRVAGTEDGYVYADVVQGAASQTINDVIQKDKKEYSKRYPKGTITPWKEKIVSKDGTPIQVYRFESNDKDTFFELVAFFELKPYFEKEEFAKILDNYNNAFAVITLTMSSEKDLKANTDNFKRLLADFSEKSPTENADIKIIDLVKEAMAREAGECRRPSENSTEI